MLPLHEAAVRRTAGRWRGDPIGYAETYLGQTVTPQQARIAERLAEPPRRVMVPSANKVGKTFAAGWLVNWHHDSYDPGIVVATSATGRQVRRQLFREVRRLRPFGLGLLPRASEIHHHEAHYVLGFSTDTADAFQGSHEEAFLLVMDEATSVHAEFWDRAESMFTGEPGHGWVCFYNPNDPTTPCYAAEQSGEWVVERLSALDHPNVVAELKGKAPDFPAAVRLRRIERRIAKECEYHGEAEPPDGEGFLWPPAEVRRLVPPNAGSVPWGWYKPTTAAFEVQILGRWPSKAFSAVWGEADLRRCRRSVTIDPDWPVQIGVDASRFGQDRTVFAVRKGTAVVHLEARTAGSWPTRRVSHHIADRLRELCHRYAPRGVPEKRVPCLIDDTGGYGSGVTDYPEGYSFYGVNSSETADRPDRYPNRRSEMIFTLRLAADEDALFWGSVQRGGELVRELEDDLRAIRTVPDRKSRQVAEGKPGIKARLRRSPDVADAVALAWYAPPGVA